MNRILKEKGPILFLLAAAALLRFWNIHTLEYHYDELSAILRALGLHNWNEHIQNGVLPDGHPAGIQTLIWVTGDHVTLLKSMAALAGTAAVYFIYRSGLVLFQPATAYASAVLLAISYPALFWSQQIRPYAFGLCATTALLWIAAQIVFEKKQHISKYLLMGILAAACSYIHYFSGLFALIIMAFVLIFSAGKWKYNFISWMTAAVLFLPHIAITIHQLNAGGLGWLSKPSISFIPEHLFQIFSNSGILMAIILIPVITGILVLVRNKIKPPAKNLWILFALFILPLTIGFLYSIWRAPVLQHSVLLFSLPPFLLILAYFISQLPVNFYRVQLLIILFGGISVIIWNRQHYSMVYKEPYSSAVKYMVSHPQQHYVADVPKDIFAYYINKFDPSGQVKFRYLLLDRELFSFRHAKKIAEKKQETLVVSSGSHPGLVPIFEDFTYSSKYSDPKSTWIGLEIPEFRSLKPDSFLFSNYPLHYNWNGQAISIPFTELKPEPNDVIVVRYSFPSNASPWGEIQTGLYNNNRLIDWRSTPMETSWSAGIHSPFHFIKLADIPGWNENTVLVLNSDQGYKGGGFHVRLSKGNPYLYGVPKH